MLWLTRWGRVLLRSHNSLRYSRIPNILWKPKINYHVHNNSPLVFILNWSIQYIPSYLIFLRFILILSSHLYLGLPNCLFSHSYLTKMLYASAFYPMRVTCPAHPILLHLIILIVTCDFQVMKLLKLEFSLVSCCFIPLCSKYSPQHPLLKHPHSTFFPSISETDHV
jgi:hypothetical protein